MGTLYQHTRECPALGNYLSEQKCIYMDSVAMQYLEFIFTIMRVANVNNAVTNYLILMFLLKTSSLLWGKF